MGKNIEIFQTIVFDGTFGFRKKGKKTIYQDINEAHTKFKL